MVTENSSVYFCQTYVKLNLIVSNIGFNRLDDQIFINKNVCMPTVLRFHPYEPYLAVADKEGIR